MAGTRDLIDLIGIGAEGPAGLRAATAKRVRAAEFLAGGERNLAHFAEGKAERFVIRNNMNELVAELSRRVGAQRCVVLATGDPMFFGIGRALAERVGAAKLRIEPALSSMQLAFARAGLPWDGATLASVHGRDLRPTLLPLLGRRTIGLFTEGADGPAAVAGFFASFGLTAYEAVVGEDLGSDAERVSSFPDLTALAGQRFAPLNYLILRRTDVSADGDEFPPERRAVPGVPDGLFARPDDGPEVLTRQEIRAVTVARLLEGPLSEPGTTVWDIGAGLGTVSVEVAVLRPHLEVLAVERDPARAKYLRENRARFGAYNVRVVEGAAPEALEREPELPSAVFLGGSGHRLPEILALVWQRLRPLGRFVATFVTLENLAETMQSLRGWGWPFEVTELHVSRSDGLPGLTGLRPLRGVFIVSADKPLGEAR